MSESVNILVIDDSEDDRLLYSRALRKSSAANYVISEAENGEEGLKRIDDGAIACVLLDYSLPGRNGIEVLKRIRSNYPFIPVVMLTGQGNENVAVAAMQEGAQNYIAKSTITPETLEHVIRMAMQHCALQKRIHEQRTSLEIFTRALAHDLKEPLRTIRSFVELLGESERFVDKTQRYFDYIRSAADRMHLLIDTVFLYTRLDDPGQMAKENCDVGSVLADVKANLAQLIRERGAVITADSLPTVYVNRIQLLQLFQNLISNAIHHSEHSEKPVAVHIHAERQGDQWLFKVSDNGPGIEEDHLQKIFEPFKRMTRYEDQGVGLGLAICRKVVEAHGGKIWCESKLEEGATFLFTLPVTLPKEVEHHAAAAKPAAANGHAALAATLLANVLLVDDSRADLEITRFRLIERSKLNCNLFVAHDGEEALDMLRKGLPGGKPYDLVLLDINMPEMDGFELLEQMRADDSLRDVTVVMCTGSIYDKDMERAEKLGAAGYLVKPIEFANLKSLIEVTPSFKLSQENNGYSLTRAA